MPEPPAKIKEALEKFIENLKKHLGEDVQVYLFGSYARGDWLTDSDIDVIVISEKLKETPHHQRYPKLRKLAPPTHPFEILAYTPSEFKKAREKSIVLKDAEKHWVKLT